MSNAHGVNSFPEPHGVMLNTDTDSPLPRPRLRATSRTNTTRHALKSNCDDDA